MKSKMKLVLFFDRNKNGIFSVNYHSTYFSCKTFISLKSTTILILYLRFVAKVFVCKYMNVFALSHYKYYFPTTVDPRSVNMICHWGRIVWSSGGFLPSLAFPCRHKGKATLCVSSLFSIPKRLPTNTSNFFFAIGPEKRNDTKILEKFIHRTPSENNQSSLY